MAGSPTDRERFERKYRHNLEDIIRYGESVINKLADVSLEDFAPDDDLRDLVTYRVQCVSEAAVSIAASSSLLAARPSIQFAGSAPIPARAPTMPPTMHAIVSVSPPDAAAAAIADAGSPA